MQSRADETAQKACRFICVMPCAGCSVIGDSQPQEAAMYRYPRPILRSFAVPLSRWLADMSVAVLGGPNSPCSRVPASCCSRSTTSLVDIIYFARALWRALAVYTRYPRAFASALPDAREPGFFAMFVPAWDESAVIASMLRATVSRLDYDNYRIFVGHYRNDPATAAAIAASPTTGSKPSRSMPRADHEGGLPQPSLRRVDRLRVWRAAVRRRPSSFTTPRTSFTRSSSRCSTG